MEKQKNRTVYGRRQSRPLKESQKDLWKNLFPAVRLDLEFLPNPYAKNVIFEIGFGGGENLVHQAINNPNAICIGCEPFVNGVASLLSKIATENITNIKIFNDDAKILAL